MTQILSASCGSEGARYNAMLNVLANPSYYRPGASQEFRLKKAKQILNKLMTAEAIEDNPKKSYTSAPINDSAKNIKIPPASVYQDFSTCTKDLVENLGVDRNYAENHCKELPGNPNDFGAPTEPKSGMDMRSCIQKAKDNGVTDPDAIHRLCSTLATDDNEDQQDQGKDEATEDNNLKASRFKQASIPSWAIVSSGLNNPVLPNNPVAPRNIKSAANNASYNNALYNTSLADVLTSKVERLEKQANKLRSASSTTNKPQWASSLSMFDDV